MGTPDSKPKTNGHAVKAAPPPTDLLSQDSAYAKRHRKLLDQLIAIGIEKLMDVPKIAVVGSQSAGKSSILEALSGITFPRASGTCTRCPSEVRLFSSEEDWVCTVSLRFDKDINGNRLDKVRNVPFGGPITDPRKVQSRLLQAQRAILNPTMAPESFIQEKEVNVKTENGSAEVKVVNEVQFSENVICIEVKGKNVRDLSVVDLPGLIANVGENEDARNIDLIKNLAKKEIAKENCIILLCVTMSEDFQNQPSVMMAKEADPTGKRTLGCLTKPDRIEEGVFSNWKPVLEGKEQKLLHGYYVVKNPDPKQLGSMTHEEARAHEKHFFTKKPWADLPPHITSRLGSPSLAGKLSTLLEQIIKARMPSIVEQVKAMHGQVQKDLSSLPEQVPEGQLLSHLVQLIGEFNKDLQIALLESQEEQSLAEDLYRISLDFWADMVNHRPRFLAVTEAELTKLKAMEGHPAYIVGLKQIKEMRDYLFEDDQAELTARGIAQRGGPSDKDDLALVPYLEDLTKETTKYGSDSLAGRLGDGITLLNLTMISNIKARATRDLLPNNTPWSVKKKLINMCLESWPGTTFHALQKIESRVLKECKALIKKHFALYQVGGLENVVNRIVEKLVVDQAGKARGFLVDLIKVESRYTTISTHKFVARQEALKKCFEQARLDCRINKNQKNESTALGDCVDDELNLIAEIRLYWQVAFKRYIDNVRSAFYTILLEPIAESCSKTLTSELGIFKEGALQRVKSLLQEDQDIVQRRDELLVRDALLKQSLEVITNFSEGALHTDE